MLRGFFRSQFFFKLFYELLPATIASAIGAYFINNYFKPQPPVQTEAATVANAELMHLLRDQQTLLADYLKKSTEAHQRADQAAAQETDRIKAAERDAIAALREAKTAELRALAAAVSRAGEASERRLAAKPAAAPTIVAAPLPPLERSQTERPTGEPLQLHQAASATPPPQMSAPIQNQAQAQAVPPQTAARETAARESDNGAIATLKSAVSAVERMPSRVMDWFSAAAAPPRPPSDLPQRHFMKAAM